MKKFKDIAVGEKVFMLDPKPKETAKVLGLDFEKNPGKYIKHQILELTVTKSSMHPKSHNQKVWMLETFLPNRLQEVMTDAALKEAEGFDTTNTKQVYLLPADESKSILMVQPLPTMMATTAEQIERWVLGKS